MERLTEINESKKAYFYPKCFEKCGGIGHSQKCDRCDLSDRVCDKLGKYEDLEEQGKLLKLPCAVGNTVWELCKCDDDIYRIFPMKVTNVVPYGSIRWIKGKEPAIWNVYAISDSTDMYKSFYDFGETVFLTQEEAEAALKAMRE